MQMDTILMVDTEMKLRENDKIVNGSLKKKPKSLIFRREPQQEEIVKKITKGNCNGNIKFSYRETFAIN